MFKLSKRIFTSLLLLTVLAGSVKVQAEPVVEDTQANSTVLEHNMLDTEKDIDKDLDYYEIVFEKDVKELTYPVEVTKQGVLLMTLKDTDPNYISLSAQLYEDEGLTKKIGGTIYLSSGEENDFDVAEIKKSGTYYMKFDLSRKYDYNEQLKFLVELDLVPGGIREIKKDITYLAYQDYDTSENLYKINVYKTGLVTLNIGFSSENGEYGQSARVTLLNSKKKAISEQVGLYSEKNEDGTYNNELYQFYALTKGTYYIKIDTSGGLHALNYTISNVADKSGASLSKAAGIKVGGSAVSGICTNSDKTTKVDWYKITLKNDKVVTFNINSKIDGKLKVEICDSKGDTVWYGSFYLYEGAESGEIQSDGKWGKGTYYIKVYKTDAKSSGYYSIKVK